MFRLKHLAEFRLECISTGERPYVALEHIASWEGSLIEGKELPIRTQCRTGMASVEPGDVLFGKLRPYLAKTWVVDRPALASTELMCLRPRPGVDSRWLGYLTNASPFVEWAVATSEGTKMPRTSWEKVGEFRAWLPSQSAQRRIADYLDVETSRIDTLISKKRRLIDLLTERRQVLITAALTCDMFNGVARIPLKHLVGINQRVLPETTDPGREIRYVDIGSVGRGRLVKEPERMRFSDAPSRARRLVRQGDTIVSTVRTYLRAVWPVGGDTADLVVSTGFAVLTPKEVDPRYFSWWVLSDAFIEEMVARSVGVSYPAINASELGDLPIQLPTLAEQRAIADYLGVATRRIDALISKTHRIIALLAERRQALITAAVTGQLAIPGVAA